MNSPVYLDDAFALRVTSFDSTRSPAYRLGISAAEIEREVVDPWRRNKAIVIDGQRFEPDSYSVEIRRCPVIVDRTRAAFSYAVLDEPPITDRFLNTQTVGQAEAAGTEDRSSSPGPQVPAQPPARATVAASLDRRPAESKRPPSVLGPEVAFGFGVLGISFALVSAFGAKGVTSLLLSFLVAAVLTAILNAGLGPLSRALDVVRRGRRRVWWLGAAACFILGSAVLVTAWPNRSGVPGRKSRGTGEQPASSEPSLNRDATCASVKGASDGREHPPHTIYVASPGQLSEGPQTLLGRVLPDGKYTPVIRSKAGDEIQFSAELHNTGYGSVTGVDLRAVMRRYGPNCWRTFIKTHSSTDRGGNVKLGPALMVVATSRSSRLVYVPHSTVLYDERGKALARLPDGLVGKGTPLPYAIPPTTYFVNFRVRVTR